MGSSDTCASTFDPKRPAMDQLELTAANYVDSDEEKDMLKEQKIKDAIEANSGFTVCILKIKFLIDGVGLFLGESCVQLACLSATIEACGHD